VVAEIMVRWWCCGFLFLVWVSLSLFFILFFFFLFLFSSLPFCYLLAHKLLFLAQNTLYFFPLIFFFFHLSYLLAQSTLTSLSSNSHSFVSLTLSNLTFYLSSLALLFVLCFAFLFIGKDDAPRTFIDGIIVVNGFLGLVSIIHQFFTF
jgi:hypothetical protein